jgi:hypothetical protein
LDASGHLLLLLLLLSVLPFLQVPAAVPAAAPVCTPQYQYLLLARSL